MQRSETMPAFVDLNVLPEELRPWPYQRLFVMGVLALLALGLLLVPLYQAEQDAAAETAALKAQQDLLSVDLALAQAELGNVRALQRQLETAETDLATLNRERQAIMREGQKMSQDLSAVVSALPAGASLKSVTAGDGQTTLTGRALSREDVFRYAGALERSRKLSEARVTSLVSQDGEAGAVTFTIETVR